MVADRLNVVRSHAPTETCGFVARDVTTHATHAAFGKIGPASAQPISYLNSV